MAYIKDIINVLGDNATDYKLTVIGDKCIVIEGFRSIVSYKEEEMIVRSGKRKVQVLGKCLKIRDLACGYILIEGQINCICLIGDVK